MRYEDDENFVRFLISEKLFWLYWERERISIAHFSCLFDDDVDEKIECPYPKGQFSGLKWED